MPRQDRAQQIRSNPEYLALLDVVERLDFIGQRLHRTARFTPFRSVTNTATGVPLLRENPERRSLVIFNNSGADVYVHTEELDGNNSSAWVKIPDGGFWEPYYVPTNRLYVIGTSGVQEVFGYEGV